jgi:hypothetical protein
VTDAPALTSSKLAAEAVKRVRWAVSKHTSTLAITKTSVGLLGWAQNLILRRPPEFPTAQYARFRREIAGQVRQNELTDADIAVVKLRADLLGSPIDSRSSAPVDGADVDGFALRAIGEVEAEYGVTLDDEARTRAFDAAWSSFGEFLGCPARPRAAHIAAAVGFLEVDGASPAKRLRAAEVEYVSAFRAYRPAN